jgi:hypothetical protein
MSRADLVRVDTPNRATAERQAANRRGASGMLEATRLMERLAGAVPCSKPIREHRRYADSPNYRREQRDRP